MGSRKDKVFEAESLSLHELVICKGGVAGFRIPVYQRYYDWDKSHLIRLFEDVLSGLLWCKDDVDSLAFLGTLIVVDETNKEQKFDGQSLSVIDGQQRLTTLSLLSSVLYNRMKTFRSEFSGKNEPVNNWLCEEAEAAETKLLDFCYGTLRDGSGYASFPRIVREEEDYRAKNTADFEYKSLIGKYLHHFSIHVASQKPREFDFQIDEESKEGAAFARNINYLNRFTKYNNGEDDFSVPLLSPHDFEKKGVRQLFSKTTSDQDENNRLISKLSKSTDDSILSFARTIVFANYLFSRVYITLVETAEEKYAFDIFDSLNTTGEPLTAIQTFKPQVIKFEKDAGGKYSGSQSNSNFDEIDLYLDSFGTSEGKQRESKELVVGYALLVKGEKLSLSLDAQRRFMRARFAEAKSPDIKRKLIKSLLYVVDYRKRFWNTTALDAQLSSVKERDVTLVCLSFLTESKTSLSIPILARYYSQAVNKNDLVLFVRAVKALTAFVALRRAATGGTAGIDSDLRALMARGRRVKGGDSKPLKVGVNQNYVLPDISELKSYLREWLEKNKIDVTDYESWASHVKTQGLYGSSAVLCRFLLLCAHHNSTPDSNSPGMIKKSRPSSESDYLNLNMWKSERHATVEHVAPSSSRDIPGWDSEIYTYPYLKGSLGNLTLLPFEENISASNRGWGTKKLLYRAFAAKEKTEVEVIIEEASKKGVQFSKKNKQMLDQGMHLPLVAPLIAVDTWDRKMIEARTSNICKNAWEEISPWIGF